MPTNDERRKIAAELRENRDPLTPYNLVDYIFDDPWNHDRCGDVADRLADHIEPEPERTCRMIDNGVELCCSVCDRRHGYDDEPDFCMGCGAKVVHQ